MHACQDSVRESTWAAVLHLSRLPPLHSAPFTLQLHWPPLWLHLSLSGGISFTCTILNQILHSDPHPLSSCKLPWPTDSAAPSWSFFSSSSSKCNSYPAPSVPMSSRRLARPSQPSVSFLSPSSPQNSCYLIMFSRKLHLHSVYLQVLKFCHASLKVLTFQFRLNYSVAHFQPNFSFLQGQLSRHWSPNSL